ncbi:uncharacterized protein LAESUDRAFT_764732 [Laetiporus sulphureus 93-53]|uniref:FAD-binding oxidoreductase/transferase type 4 C-terminal domain-containing protein n=1 Tax=Laetiporus sulphureus 93-53 TaxID=1314785 RepID=A0A165B5X2_9APHY|nr:uncharacterized protein LAESUDRAFT_764732 [Laetiporus sulphureus 93-53]KZT00311.1 hypothetical protein LAESUDRAFT_764732 [Laetiporus sulphureus 93-53]
MGGINSTGEISRKLPISDMLFFKIQGDKEGISITAATTDEEVAKLWESRNVPPSQLPQLVSTIFGHVSDGNFHALILFMDDKELQKLYLDPVDEKHK